jgi:hypothetical protein
LKKTTRSFLGELYGFSSAIAGALVRRRIMRQLIGRIPIQARNVIEEVYFSEHVRCQKCQITVPVGIEVVTITKQGKTKMVVKHAWYCRAHGSKYATRVQ